MWYTRRSKLDEFAGLLEDLAAELRREHAVDTLRAVYDASQYQYPATASGAGTHSPGGTDRLTPTEAKATRPDPTGRFAATVITTLGGLPTATAGVLSALRQWDPNRPVAKCARCDHPIPRGYQRCQRVDPDTGIQCGSSDQHVRTCRNPHCGRVMQTGEYLRAGRCDPCRKHWDRHGRERVPAAALELDDGVIDAIIINGSVIAADGSGSIHFDNHEGPA